MLVMKDDKVLSELPAAVHLNAMLRSEAFLRQFLPVDEVTTQPLYLDDFSLARPGYNNGGLVGGSSMSVPYPEIADSTETMERFLDVMAFASDADRTNTVGAALTVLLRRHWLGQKPVVIVTATKSHSGKGTITEFFRGSVPKADVLYESIDWPMQVPVPASSPGQSRHRRGDLRQRPVRQFRSGAFHPFSIHRELCHQCRSDTGLTGCGRASSP